MNTRRFGVTLLELLVVVTVILIVVSVTAPVFMRAKRSAKNAQSISNLRQCGIAASMYMEQNDQPPRGCPQLVSAGMIPKELCSALNDPYDLGMANVIVQEIATDVPRYAEFSTTYKNSYIGPREYDTPTKFFALVMDECENPGWLADLTGGDEKNLESSLATRRGTYYRLMIDGSVRKAQHTIHFVPGSQTSILFKPFFLFAECSDEWIATSDEKWEQSLNLSPQE